MDNESPGLDSCSLWSDAWSLGPDGQFLRLDNRSQGPDGRSLGLDNRSLGPDSPSLDSISEAGWSVFETWRPISLAEQLVIWPASRSLWTDSRSKGPDGQLLGPDSQCQEPDNLSLKLYSSSLGPAIGLWARRSIFWAGQLKYCCYITSFTSFKLISVAEQLVIWPASRSLWPDSQSQKPDGRFLGPDWRSLGSDGQRLGPESRYQEPDSRSLQSHSLGRVHTGSRSLGQMVDLLGWAVKILLLYNKFCVI